MSYQLSFFFFYFIAPKTKIPLNNRTGSSNSQLSILFFVPVAATTRTRYPPRVNQPTAAIPLSPRTPPGPDFKTGKPKPKKKNVVLKSRKNTHTLFSKEKKNCSLTQTTKKKKRNFSLSCRLLVNKY